MKFHSYQPENLNYNLKYGQIQSVFPYAFLVLERFLRFSTADPKIVNPKLLKYITRVPITKWLLFIAYRKLLLPILFFIWRTSSSTNIGCCFIGLYHFPHLSRRSIAFLRKQKIRLLGDSRSFANGNFLDSLLHIHFLPLSNIYFLSLFLSIKKNGIDSIVNNQELLSDIEKHVKSEVELFSKILSLINVRLIIALGDDQPVSRVLIKAASRVGCRYYVIAHGLFQEPTLLCIAPVNADKLFVWTEKQRSDLVSVMEPNEAIKVKYIGSPFKVFDSSHLPLNHDKDLKCLLVLDPRDANHQSTKRLFILNEIVRLLVSYNVSVVIRRHPQDIKRYSKPEPINLSKLVRLSKPRELIDSQLRSVDFVIGESSSVLFQAFLHGKQAIQVSELALAEVEGSAMISICELESNLFGKISTCYPGNHEFSLPAQYEMNLDILFDFSDCSLR